MKVEIGVLSPHECQIKTSGSRNSRTFLVLLTASVLKQTSSYFLRRWHFPYKNRPNHKFSNPALHIKLLILFFFLNKDTTLVRLRHKGMSSIGGWETFYCLRAAIFVHSRKTHQFTKELHKASLHNGRKWHWIFQK